MKSSSLCQREKSSQPEGTPYTVPGLYAAGSDTSGVYGNSYVYFEGGTLGYAYNSGRIAGQSASAYVSEK